MGDCEAILRELDAFLDDELTDEARQYLHEHLGACTDCYSAFDFHAELKLAIRRKCSTEEIPNELMARIEQCLRLDSVAPDSVSTGEASTD